jgi:hypothetical protein
MSTPQSKPSLSDFHHTHFNTRNNVRSNTHSVSMPTIAEDVLILGSKAYSNALGDMMAKIGCETIFVQTYDALGEAAEDEETGVTAACHEWHGKLEKAEKRIADIYVPHGK